MKRPSSTPVLAEVIRGGEVESMHRGSAVVRDAHGHTVFSIGQVCRKVFPRSAYKFIQAIPLLESGAADAFGLGPDRIALACASHNAERMHVEGIERWLEQLGLTDEDLECGPGRPGDPSSADRLIREGVPAGRKHHNCSGKHLGMLTLAQHWGVPIKGYSEYDHPTQVAWRMVMRDLMQVDTECLTWERDGCGLPALCMPMNVLAAGLARYARSDGDYSTRSNAMTRILAAVRQHPTLVAGSGRCCTAVIQKTQGRILVKTGAEGMYCGIVPEQGLGFALKVDDGARRGSEVALGGLLDTLGLLADDECAALAPWFRPAVVNSQGRPTGRIGPGRGWTT